MSKKNLLYVFADQWRGDAIGYAKADPVKTPNMDAFCQDATYCDHAFSTFPVCSPHRASLMTGKYPLSVGFFTNCKNGLPLRLADEEQAMGDVLKNAGYQTAYIGKWHLDEPEQNNCEEPISGARDWDAFTPPGCRRHGFDYWYSYGTYDMHMSPHYWEDTPEMIQPEVWSAQHETDKAIEYIRKRDPNKPFAMCISWNPPHSVYDQVPDKYMELYPDVELKETVCCDNIHHHTGEQVGFGIEEMKLTTRQYYAAISGLDEQFGRLIQTLKQENIYEDTVVVLSADHGDMMGAHGLMGKHVWYEESIRIPLVIRIPGNRKKVCSTCIASQDQLPTLLGVLGIDTLNTFEGDDCSVYLTEEQDNADRVSFLCACPGGYAVVQKFTAAGKDPRDFGWRGVRTRDYTYVMELGYDVAAKPRRYLYCVTDDPLQKQTLSLDDPECRELAKGFERDILGWMDRQKDGFANNWRDFISEREFL